MKTAVVWLLILTGVPMGLTGCMNVGTGTSPSTRFYLLESRVMAEAPPSRRDLPVDLTLGIGPVMIPPYLDRPQIITRINDQELIADEFNQWAEPLQATITRTMGENLSRLIGGAPIRIHPWPRSSSIDLQIALDVLRFDTGPSGSVTFSGVWRLVDLTDNSVLVERQAFIERPPGGTATADRVEAMSLVLADLAREIIGAINKFPPR